MDGVPFMISEKFSCVPESVSFIHAPRLLPPQLGALLSVQHCAGSPLSPPLPLLESRLPSCSTPHPSLSWEWAMLLPGPLQLTLHIVGA